MRWAVTILRTYWLIITFFLLAVITLLSLIPLPDLPLIPGNDKIQHFIAYGAVMFSVALRQPKYWLIIALFLICWSGGIELLQPYVNRYCDWMDLLANGTGVVLGSLFALFINRIYPDSVKVKD